MSVLSPTMPTHLRVAVLEDALARVCGCRGGNELHVNDQGDRTLHIYDYDTPSPNGGCASVVLNLTSVAIALERELS